MSTPLEVRNNLRRQLALLRDQIEANIDICLASPSNVRHQERAVQLQADHMKALLAFADAGGIVLAVPLYKRDCRNLRTHLRTHHTHRLLHYQRYYPHDRIPTWLQHHQPLPNTGIFYVVHAVMRKDGNIKHLDRLQGPIGEPCEDERVWKWMFCDLKEEEGVGTVVSEMRRWGWAGKFGWGMELAGGEAWGDVDGREMVELI